MGVARLVRGQVLSLEGARVRRGGAGRSARRTSAIIVRHLLPNSLGPILVALTTVGRRRRRRRGDAVVLRLRRRSPAQGRTSLGNLSIAEAPESIMPGYWWLVGVPVLALVLTVVCINFIGDGLRDAFDPKLDGRE